jgi:hypothetical protein
VNTNYNWGDICLAFGIAAGCLAIVVAEWTARGPRIRFWKNRK